MDNYTDFYQIFPSMKDSNKDKEQPLYIPPFTTIEYELKTIVEKIRNINNLSESEIRNIIFNQYKMILNYDLFLSDPSSRKLAQELFTNNKFLKIFNDICNVLNLTNDEIICLNKLCYDYYTLDEKDSTIMNYLLAISYQINDDKIIRLSSILGINGARILSMISKSSFKEDKRVQRINNFIIKYNEIDLTLQNIIDIYCILYGDRFSILFTNTMGEAYIENLVDIKEKYRYTLITYAVILILESLTSDNISKVLYNYGFYLKLNKIEKVRISLKSFNDYDINRIIKIINNIEKDNIYDLYIP